MIHTHDNILKKIDSRLSYDLQQKYADKHLLQIALLKLLYNRN